MASVLRSIVGSKPKKQKSLSDIGVSTIANEATKERISEYKTLDKYIKDCAILPSIEVYQKKKDGKEYYRKVAPEQKIRLLIDNIQKVNGKLHEISVPWGRAGSERWYAEAMIAWSTLSTLFINIAVGISIQLEQIASVSEDPLRGQNELVSKLHTVVVDVFIKYAQIVYSISWYRDDVSNAWALTIYQPPMPSSGRIDMTSFTQPESQNPPSAPSLPIKSETV